MANTPDVAPLPQISEAHGELCACESTLQLSSLKLEAKLQSLVVDVLSSAGEKATVAALYRQWPAVHQSTAEPAKIVDAVREICRDICFSEEYIASASMPWSLRWYPGGRTFAERWPDDVEEYEWSAWSRGELHENADPAAGWDVVRHFALSEEVPTDFTYSSIEDYVPFVFAERDHLQPQQVLDLSEWPAEKRLRVLLAMRDGTTDPVSIARLATETQTSVESVRLLIEYLDAAEQGTVAKDPTTALLLQRYPPERTADVVRIVAMVDAEAREAAEAAALEEPELLEDRDAFIYAPAQREAVAADGGPDPLSIVRQLLPGGAGVLGPPPIIYTPTLLDQRLLPAMQEYPPTLVILSGNAGDGKTAFIARVLKSAGEPYDATQNEYNVTVGSNHYLIVLDGSEDTETLTNEQLLDKALGAFQGDEPAHPERGTLIAVNKGRLLHFLESHREDYRYLWRLASSQFLGSGRGESASPYQLIDLNERSMLAPDPDASIFGGIVSKLVQWDRWNADCLRCPAVARCPVHEAILQLREAPARRQLWRVISAADLDDRVHVTARHLVTKIADAVVGDHRCADVRSRVERGDRFASEERFTSRLFVADTSLHVESTVMNRVVSTYDPSEHGSPSRDRKIVYRLFDPPTVSEADRDALRGDDAAAEAARGLTLLSVDEKPSPGAPDFRERLVALVRHASRRLYFVAPDDELAPPSALTVQDRYRDALASEDLSGHVPALTRQLNATLGVGDDSLMGLLVPRDYARGLAGTGFAALIPRSTLELVPATHNGAEFVPPRFLEAWPRGMLLTMRDGDRVVARLLLSFLMLEVLDRAGRGFRPLGQTEKSYMVRLGGFYRRAAEHTWSTPPTYVLYRSGKLLTARIDANELGLGIH